MSPRKKKNASMAVFFHWQRDRLYWRRNESGQVETFSSEAWFYGQIQAGTEAFHPFCKLGLCFCQPSFQREWRLSCWQWGVKAVFFELWAKKVPSGMTTFSVLCSTGVGPRQHLSPWPVPCPWRTDTGVMEQNPHSGGPLVYPSQR